jgi:hypothetical protein
MPAYSFQSRFIERIRAPRKVNPRIRLALRRYM